MRYALAIDVAFVVVDAAKDAIRTKVRVGTVVIRRIGRVTTGAMRAAAPAAEDCIGSEGGPPETWL